MPLERHVRRPAHVFIDVYVGFAAPIQNMSILLVKLIVTDAVRVLFGSDGVARYPLDVLAFDAATQRCVLATPAAGVVDVRAALTLLGTYDGKEVKILVLRTSSHLMSLAGVDDDDDDGFLATVNKSPAHVGSSPPSSTTTTTKVFDNVGSEKGRHVVALNDARVL
jgi:RNase P/RNase MRP subunit POP5